MITGFAAFVLKKKVYRIEDNLLRFYASSQRVYLFLVFPLVGIVLTVFFLRFIIRDNVGHGVPRILYAISKLDGSMRRHKLFSSLIGGSLTAGFGGFALSRSLNEMFSGLGLREGNFTLIGMASVLSDVLQEPLTAIFLIAEMSNGYELIVPLMLFTSIAFLIAKTFNKHSLFHRRLIEQGLFLHFRDKVVLKQMKLRELVEKNVLTINVHDNLGDLVELVKKAKRNIFAVVDDDNVFIEVISLDEIRSHMFDKKKYKEPVINYLYQMLNNDKVSVNDEYMKL